MDMETNDTNLKLSRTSWKDNKGIVRFEPHVSINNRPVPQQTEKKRYFSMVEVSKVKIDFGDGQPKYGPYRGLFSFEQSKSGEETVIFLNVEYYNRLDEIDKQIISSAFQKGFVPEITILWQDYRIQKYKVMYNIQQEDSGATEEVDLLREPAQTEASQN